jgi:hypothetical protein
VLAANLASALAFAWVSTHMSVFTAETRAVMSTLGLHVLEPARDTVFLTDVFAGWLIARPFRIL